MPTLPALPSVITSEPPALDLMNTRVYLSEQWIDVLDDRDNRTEWLTAEVNRVGIAAKDAAAFSDEAAAALKALRGDVADAVESARHGKRPPQRALARINDAARTSPASPQARWDGAALTTSTHRTGPLAERLAASFAEAALELLTSPDITKVRVCEAPWCAVLFLATNPRRRWCMASVCGNRARVARYYLRHKDE
ncbi:MAG: CGNR zinc finger domain-containing protein [Janibacter sp.]